MSRPPSNFSWVSDSVAGFAFPYTKEEVQYLVNDAKISHIITMCYEVPEAVSQFSSLNHYHLPVENFSPAQITTIKRAIEIIKAAENTDQKVGVHCRYGQGRAGTILACYLAYKHNLDGKTALERLRKLRPGSVDYSQERVVINYAKSIQS